MKKSFGKMVALIIVAALIVVSVATVSFFREHKIVLVETGSMKPTISEQQFVIVEKYHSQVVKVGEVIMFKHNGGNVIHRVVERKADGTGVIIDTEYTYITKGDNNEEKDTYGVTSDQIVGVVKQVVKKDGIVDKILSFLN